MSNAGGGKIRPKRTHTAKKPYSRPKSSDQGLLGRVKNTLSHLTPSWLTHMWNPLPEKNKEDTDESSEDSPQQTRRRVSFESELTRFRENRANVQTPEASFKSPADVPFMRYEPLTSSTPVEGEQTETATERVRADKEDDSNSDESISTSGCSSLVPHVDKQDYKDRMEKKTGVERKTQKAERENREQKRGLWSDLGPTTARTSSVGQPQQSSKSGSRPSFNTSYFGSPLFSPNATTPPITPGGSSFYPGRTSFGGASSQRSASKRRRTSPYEIYQPVKRQMRPKPVNSSTDDYGETSVTAKRILDTLERMSTPLSDARRIPVVPSSSPLSFTPFGRGVGRGRTPGGSFLTSRAELAMKTAPPVYSLRTPLPARISKNRQPATPAVSVPQQKKQPQVITAQATSTPTVSLSDAKDTSKETGLSRSGGKMKTRSRTNLHYSAGKDEEEEEMEQPDLPPDVPLPLANTKAIKFDLNIPAPVAKSPPAPVSKPLWGATSTPAVASSSPEVSFKFSSPISKEPVEGIESDLHDAAHTAQATFQFSAPKPVSNDNSNASPSLNFQVQAPAPFAAKKLVQKPKAEVEEEETSGGGLKPAKELKSGSCLEVFGILGSQKASKPDTAKSSLSASGTKNSPITIIDDDSSSVKPKTNIWDKPNAAEAKWECSVCMIMNSASKDSCAACGEAKPGSEKKAPAKPSIFGSQASNTGSWECPGCMVMNKADMTKCPCCQTVKPGSKAETPASMFAFGTNSTNMSLAEKFKPAAGSWECTSCLVRNKSDVKSCVACGGAQPGSSQSSAAPAVKFGVTNSESTTSASPSFKFGAAGESAKSAPSFKFGASTESKAATPSFKFGAASSKSEAKLPASFRFGANSEGAATTAPSIKFGASNSTATPDKVGATEKTGSIFDQQKPDTGKWECDTCMVRNKSSDNKCVACQTPKPGTQPSLASPPKPSLNFGTSDSSKSASGVSSGFTFGTAGSSTSELNAKPTSQVINTSASVNSVTSGDTSRKAAEPSKPSITFGTGLATAKDSVVTPTITFESKPATQAKDSESTKPATGGLFPKPESTQSNSVMPTAAPPSYTFGAKTDSAGTGGSFAFGQVKTTESAPSATGFTFGQKVETTTVSAKVQPTPQLPKPEAAFTGAVAPFQFGATATDNKETSTSGQNSVSLTSKTEVTKPAVQATVFPFSGNTSSANTAETSVKPSASTGFTTSTDAKPAGGFVFNAGSSATKQVTPTVTPTGGFTFGATTQKTDLKTTETGSGGLFSGASAAYNFTGGPAVATTTAPSTQSTTVAPFQFTGTTPAAVSTAPSVLPSQGTSSGSGFFSQAGNTGFSATKQNSFGGSTGGFQFGAKTATTTAASATPTFGSSSSAPAFGSGMSGSSGFGSTSTFGTLNSAPSATPGTTPFGSISAGTPTATATGPSFGGPAPAFGSTAANTQQNTSAGGFAFNTNPSGGGLTGQSVFQFSGGKGSMPAPQATPTPTVGFSAPQPAAVGGFNAAPSAGAVPTSFNFAGSAPTQTPGAFNFTGNAATPTPSNPFSASGSVAGRKIKRPIRRRK